MPRRLVILGLSSLLALAGGSGLSAQQVTDDPFMTGAEPLSPEDYAQLPKQARFRAYLPKRVDLTNAFPPPGSQGPQPNCVAWATTYAARTFLNFRDRDVQPAQPSDQMSPAYVYNRLRAPGSPCAGTITIVAALNLLKNEGSVSLADFPDDMTKCAVPASDALRGKAGQYRLLDWRAVDRETKNDWRTPIILDDVKGALARGAPVIFAFLVAPDFKAIRGPGIYTRAEKPEKGGYHAMAIVGYDEDKQALRVMNSWGTGWGDKGYAWIAYDTFKLLTAEAYSLEAPTAGGKPATPEPARSPAQVLADQMAALPCGSVRLEGRRLTGFSGDAAAIDALKAAALKADPKTDFAVRHLPWPQCEAALTLAEPLARGGATVSALTETGATRKGDPIVMKDGEIFGVTATTTAARPWVSIVYLQADGSAVELHRGQPAVDAKGDRRVTIGLSKTASRFAVAPPLGNELLVAIASDKPLFDSGEVINGTERQFLTRLRAKLVSHKGNDIAASVIRLKTN